MAQKFRGISTVKEAMKAVERYGLALRDVPDALKTEAMCMAAVEQYGEALRYIPDALKTEAMCMAAVEQDGEALRFVLDKEMFDRIAQTLNIETTI
ncbi:MAG: DUF4116 domain-containing protein [Methylocystis sp.]|nr:DUF4116 domain-containing protein [Methylocystis sp.]